MFSYTLKCYILKKKNIWLITSKNETKFDSDKKKTNIPHPFWSEMVALLTKLYALVLIFVSQQTYIPNAYMSAGLSFQYLSSDIMCLCFHILQKMSFRWCSYIEVSFCYIKSDELMLRLVLSDLFPTLT